MNKEKKKKLQELLDNPRVDECMYTEEEINKFQQAHKDCMNEAVKNIKGNWYGSTGI